MAKNYGIKVSRPGFDVKTATPEQLAFSSKYQTLKIHARGNGTIDGGETITIPHNLGYVPVFMVHLDPGQLGNFSLAPSGVGLTPDIYAYADSTNLYIKANNITTTYFMQNGSTDSVREIEGTGLLYNGWAVGSTGGGNYCYGGVRFPGISLSQGEVITSASLNLYIASRDGSGEVKMNVWGIDADNCSDASPASTKTTATISSNSTLVLGDSLGLNVTSLCQEVVDRAGWNSGNAMGIIFWDNGTTDGNIYYQLNSLASTNLEITTAGQSADYKYTIFLNQIE